MNREETLKEWFRSIETNEVFSEAVVKLGDDSLLCFCHRVDERWAKALGPDGEDTDGQARELLGAVEMFRLNSKHLEVWFDDGSRWEWKPSRGREVESDEEPAIEH